MLVNYDALKQKGEPCRNGKALTLYNKVYFLRRTSSGYQPLYP